MTQPLVHIAVTTYNQEKYIAKTIDSLLNQQTNFDYQIIIGEDCGTDNTLNILKAYQKKYPKKIVVLVADKNLGIELNLLKTVKACTAKYIAICDGDDYWIDDKKLQKQVDFLEKHQDYGTVTTLRYNLFEYDKSLVPQKVFNEPFLTYNFEDVLFVNPITPSAVLFRKNLMDKYINLYEQQDELSFNDYNFFMFFAHEQKIAKLPDLTVVYRFLNESGSHSNDGKKIWNFRKRFYIGIKFYLDYFKVETKLKQQVLHNKAIEYYRFVSESNDELVKTELLSIFKERKDKIRYYLLKYYLPKTALLLEKINNRLNKRLLKNY